MPDTPQQSSRTEPQSFAPPEKPWSTSADEAARAVDVDTDSGLSADEAKRRRDGVGPNRLEKAERRSAWAILLDQFKSLIIVLLLVAMGLSFGFGQWMDGIAIGAAIVLNTAIGFVTELRGVRSMEALRQLERIEAEVLREGEWRTIDASDLVPGDVVKVSEGEVSPADLRLIEIDKLQADESALTGESVPVSKRTEALDDDTPLAERTDMLYKGAAVTRGFGRGIVVATGADTEIGRIAEMAEQAGGDVTPLEKRLDRLGRKLIYVTLGITALVIGVGVLAGRDTYMMIETGVALAVAAIPEGLPIVATVALARGMWRMAKRNAVVNRLSSVETLGSVNVLCTDKTGTLTENRMTVRRIVTSERTFKLEGEAFADEGRFVRGGDGERDGDEIDPKENDILREALRVGVLCSNAAIESNHDSGFVGDGEPMETALLVAGAWGGMRRDELLEEMPERREVAFDPETKMMATVHETDGDLLVAVKGAPGAVLDACTRIRIADGEDALDDEGREHWLDINNRLAEDGMRNLALAEKRTGSTDDDPYSELVFLGLAAMIDPPRTEVREAVDACQAAGIQLVMATGDQAATARYVGRETGLVGGDGDPETEVAMGDDLKGLDDMRDDEREALVRKPIFARISPKQKLDLIALHQSGGDIVGMTGDGVNDAPALQKADIGIAMGERGTEVAREASDVVLKDDALSTVVDAIAQGRAIFTNIRKFVVYLLSGNAAEIFAVGGASIAQVSPLPILPLQILYLNMINDVFPALALGMGQSTGDVMTHPPRDPKESIVAWRHWGSIVAYGVLLAVVIVSSLLLAKGWLGLEGHEAVTISFLTLGFGRLWHVFNMRDIGSGFVDNRIVRNPWVWGALGLCSALLIAAVYAPGLSDVLKLKVPSARGWGLAMGMSLAPLVVGQTVIGVWGMWRKT